MVFDEAYIAQTFWEARNWEILSPKLSIRLIACLESVHEKRQRNTRVAFSDHGPLRVIKRFFRPRTRCAVGSCVQGA